MANALEWVQVDHERWEAKHGDTLVCVVPCRGGLFHGEYYSCVKAGDGPWKSLKAVYRIDAVDAMADAERLLEQKDVGVANA